MADETDRERKPSYQFGRNGPSIQGFRSKPGAPLHDPTENNPISRDNSIPQGNWDRLFRNRLTGNNPLNPTGRTGGSGNSAGVFGAQPVDPLDELNRGLRQQFGIDSLETMASGGMNHAQRWSQPSTAFKMPGNSLTFTDTQTPSGVQRSTKNQFGWGSAFLPNA